MTDYRKFKTPFFEITIGDSRGNGSVKLPHHILRLISKVEIIETWEENAFHTVNITFLEGSREPGSPNSSKGTDGLYKIASYETGQVDKDISGSLTNRVGIIPDLRFSGDHGISFITKQEKRAQALDTTLQKNVVGETTTRKYDIESSKPRFLFQERNQVKVKWGYKEDPATHKTIVTYIMLISVNYPDSGQVETVVTCQDTTAALDQITVNKGQPFGTRVTTTKGNSISEFRDQTTEEMIRSICTSMKIPYVVSKNLPVPSLDQDHQKVWLAEESFTQFMTRLAKERGCYFKVIPDKNTGIDTLYFVSQQDFERDVLVDRQYLTYKAPGSIMKNASVRVDFGVAQGTTQTGYDKDGNNDTVKSEDPGQSVDIVVHENSGKKPVFTDRSPTNDTNPIMAAKGLQELTGGNTTGNTNVTPDSNQKNKETFAAWIEVGSSRVIQLDFTTLGYTRLTPGTVDVAGLGVRYSGKYRILTATHTITPDSYETRCQATSMTLGAGGLISPSSLYKKEDAESNKEQVSIQVTTSDSTEVSKKLRSVRE